MKIVEEAVSGADVVLFIGISTLGVGITAHVGWPIACEVVGAVLVGLSVISIIRGDD